jgi:hypothetical protein
MDKTIIAVICDFDGTLGPDMISFLLEEQNIEPQGFWKHITKMVEGDGWDPAQAYMHQLLIHFQQRKIALTRELLRKTGSKLRLYPGIPEVFPALKKYIETDNKLKSIPLDLEYYIISGGLEEVILGTPVADHVSGIFGCDFDYDEMTGAACAVKRTISFTEKTKYIYALNKGIAADDIRKYPYRVNDFIEKSRRRIPFDRMIYIGDGPSDIPCMSMIKQNEGVGVGVSERGGTFDKGYELARGKRITVGPYSADYRKNSDMRKALHAILGAIGLKIGVELRRHVIGAVEH